MGVRWHKKRCKWVTLVLLGRWGLVSLPEDWTGSGGAFQASSFRDAVTPPLTPTKGASDLPPVETGLERG